MILLDTYSLIRLTLKPGQLSRPAARAIERAESGAGIAVASITLWEAASLIERGRIRVTGTTESFLNRAVQRPRLVVLELTPEIAALACQFPMDFPGDPADRIIAATARAHGLPLVTKDRHMQDCPLLRTIW